MNTLRRALCAAAVVCLAAGAARANTVPVQWSYQWTPNTAFKIFAQGSNSDYILATPEPSATEFGNATIPAVSLQTFSNAPASNPAVFKNAAYSLSLTLFDQASGKSGTVPFNGVFNGTLSANQAFWQPPFTVQPATQKLTLGNNTYTVTLQVAPPGGPHAKDLGAVSANAVVTVSASSGGGVGQTPEPSGLALAGLGLAGLCGAGWLRRRGRRPALSLA
jgi:hypothetical protein